MNTAYLFDFDGTLVDSMPTFVSAMLRILDENQIPYEESIIATEAARRCHKAFAISGVKFSLIPI